MKSSAPPLYVVRFTAVGIVVHWAEIVDRPLLPTIPVMQTMPWGFGATKQIIKSRRTDEFEHLVDAARKNLLDLRGYRPGIDEYLIDAAGA